jgi:hypothetical protein
LLQAFIGLWKMHTYESGVAVVFVSLTDGSYVLTDIIRIFHEQETTAAKLGLKIGNFAADNLGPQLSFMQGISRGFSPEEDTALLANVAALGVAVDDSADDWLSVAALHNRTIYQVRRRASALLAASNPPPGCLVIPVDGWFHTYNSSATSTPLCVSPEYWHVIRLLIETVWKASKLLILSFAPYGSPAFASDYQQLYDLHINDLKLDFKCVDQSDNQNDKRAERLASLDIVHALGKYVYASRGTQMFSLVTAAYLAIFRARLQASSKEPLGVRSRLVLCGFVTAFFIYQPLGILLIGNKLKYTLKANSFTPAARSSVLLHMSGFIGIQLKGASHFPAARIVPEVFGEKCNENLHSL